MKHKFLIFFIAMLIFIGLIPITVSAIEAGIPSNLEAPVISNLVLLKTDSGVPYFRLEVGIPQSVAELNLKQPDKGWIDIETDGKVDKKDWGSSGGGKGSLNVFSKNLVPGKKNTFYIYFEMNENNLSETIVNSRNYTYRLRFKYTYINGDKSTGNLYSSWSNELSSLSDYYLGASDWAKPELDLGTQYGLLTGKIRGNMSEDVTREEFAEIVIKLYEACSGELAEVGTKTFADTNNTEILKAYNLGLVDGVGNNNFAPQSIITRAQMAKIVLNTLKAIDPNADFSIRNIFLFDDDSSIESWAKEGVYFFTQVSIFNGHDVGDKKLLKPNNSATRQTAVITCKRAFEYIQIFA